LPLHETLSARIDALDTNTQGLDTRIEGIDARIERGFAALAEDIADLRTEFIEFRTETHENFASLRGEIRDIRQRLEALEEAARNSAGFAKEIDHLMQRVVDLEKHLGIQHKIAA
jgi:chromosome segregation ATPase